MVLIVKPGRRFRLRSRRLSRSLWGNILVFVFIVGFGALMMLPILYSVVTAFKPVNELFLFPPRFFVQNPTIDNFLSIMSIMNDSWVPFGRYIVNSVLVAGIGTTAYIFIASLAAYPLAKHRFRGRNVYSRVIVWAILFRTEVTGVAVYIILAWLGLIDTYWSMILPTLAGSFGVFLMQQFMSAFPDTVLEAARIDGAGEWRIFWSVVMASVKPGWITLIIFTFQNFWNTLGTNYVYSDQMRLLPAVLSQIQGAGFARAGEAAAVALILMLPPIVIFIFSQSSVLETMAYSGIKE
jgi:ABC transporter, permease protein